MTINIFVSKGGLNGKIVVVRFFFCWVYNNTVLKDSMLNHCFLKKKSKTCREITEIIIYTEGKKFSNIL